MRCIKFSLGFSLTELLITIAIVGILTSTAVPAYINHTNKSRFEEVVKAAATMKGLVASCIAVNNNSASGCSNGAFGIPPVISNTAKVSTTVSSIRIRNGVIVATGRSPAPAKTYQLTANVRPNGTITWTVGGTCVSAGVCSK